MKTCIKKINLVLVFLITSQNLIAQQTGFTDADGNKYDTIHHNGYAIMTSNLKTTKFFNGEEIPRAKKSKQWIRSRKEKQPGYSMWNGAKKSKKKYGLIYNLYVVKDYRDLAPEGWYIPTTEEWRKILGISKGKKKHWESFYHDEDLKKQYKRSKKSRYRLKKPRWRLNFTGGGMRMWKGEYTFYEKYSNKTNDYETDSFIWTKDGYLKLFPESSYFEEWQDKNRGYYIRMVKKL